MPKYLIFTNNASFRQEAESPKAAIEQFIARIESRGCESRTKIPADREISPSLVEALRNKSLMLIVVSDSEQRPRRLLGGYLRDHQVDVVNEELGQSVRRKLTEDEFRSTRPEPTLCV